VHTAGNEIAVGIGPAFRDGDDMVEAVVTRLPRTGTIERALAAVL